MNTYGATLEAIEQRIGSLHSIARKPRATPGGRTFAPRSAEHTRSTSTRTSCAASSGRTVVSARCGRRDSLSARFGNERHNGRDDPTHGRATSPRHRPEDQSGRIDRRWPIASSIPDARFTQVCRGIIAHAQERLAGGDLFESNVEPTSRREQTFSRLLLQYEKSGRILLDDRAVTDIREGSWRAKSWRHVSVGTRRASSSSVYGKRCSHQLSITYGRQADDPCESNIRRDPRSENRRERQEPRADRS